VSRRTVAARAAGAIAASQLLPPPPSASVQLAVAAGCGIQLGDKNIIIIN